MKRKQVIKNLFFLLDKILASGEVIFSRASLLSKLNKLAVLDEAARNYTNQTLKRWEGRGLFEQERKDKKAFYCLTPAGCRQVNRYRFQTLQISSKKWDGWWRVIVFDIPESKRQGRDAIRRKLKVLGLYPLQKSVFICPFKCEREIKILSDYFDVSEYIDLFLARLAGQREKELKIFFELH